MRYLILLILISSCVSIPRTKEYKCYRVIGPPIHEEATNKKEAERKVFEWDTKIKGKLLNSSDGGSISHFHCNEISESEDWNSK